MKNIKISFKGNKIDIKVRELSLLGQMIGLMFKTKNCDNLLFKRGGRWAIHSFFVFFPFLALWLNEKNKVIEHKIVKPFRFCIIPKREFAKLVEIPLNKKNAKIISVVEAKV